MDLRMERATATSIVVMDGQTRTMSNSLESGCGIRAFIGGAWGFACTNTLTRASLKSATAAAVRLAKAARARAKISFEMVPAKATRRKEVYKCKVSLADVPIDEKLSYVLDMDKAMRSFDSRITSTNTRYDDLEVERVIANSFGTMASVTERWLISACSAWARSESVLQRGHASFGNVGGYELIRSEAANSIATEAAAQAVRLLDSKPVPAGRFACVLDNRMTGMLAHEAFGHACEADAVLASSSVLEGMVGKEVAAEGVTLIDDPTLRNTFGYFSVDWEGVLAKKHTLIEDGVLVGFLHNLESSSRMGVPPNGSARAQAFNSPPIVRMSNTYIAAGDYTKEELIGELKYGLLIQGSQYGYVEPAKGQFMFKCDEAYEIKNGEIGQRFRDASISGVILEVLKNVTGLADDVVIGDPGYCGKAGQSARTTDGGPHMRVSNMVVGGLA